MAPKQSKKVKNLEEIPTLSTEHVDPGTIDSTNVTPLAMSHYGSVFQPTGVLSAMFLRVNALPVNYSFYLKQKGYVPEGTEIWIPTSDEIRADWYSPG